MFDSIVMSMYYIDATVYSIKFYDVDRSSAEIACIHVAHHGVIYQLVWHKSDQYILTSSNDGITKCWNVKSKC